MNKSILVAGGSGFIGSHLCEELLSQNNDVVAIDNLSTSNKSNIENLIKKNPRFHFKKGNVCDEDFLKEISKKKFDEIYHLASPASVTYITEHPIEAAEANGLGTRNLLQLALSQNAKLLFASSSEVYGDPKEHPQKESYWGNANSIGVRSGYDEGKRFGEALCMAFYREKGVDVKIVRIFNTYGPNSSIIDTRVVPQFVTQALRGNEITVHGDGKQTRSFCYVTDMVSGLIKMMASKRTGPVNLGNPLELTIIEIANKVIEMTKSSSKIKFVERPQDDPRVRKPDISLAKDLLSWDPKISLEDGLKKTIAYFRKILQ